MKKHAKQRYFSNLDETISNSRISDPKKYWKYLRSLVNMNKKSDLIPILKSNSNNVEIFHYTDLEKAECLNEYFSSISNVDESNGCFPPFHPKNCNILNIIDITRQQIEDIISTLEVNKAAGPDLISHKLLKNIKQSISKPLQILFNKSLLDQTFPKKWKHSLVNPLFRKGDKSLACNYRPISVLSCVGKLMERCVYKHLYNHLYSNHLLYEK